MGKWYLPESTASELKISLKKIHEPKRPQILFGNLEIDAVSVFYVIFFYVHVCIITSFPEHK
jgi:hypothetical protein